jgi:NAD(P)-dependent dehydrogenase (short-subunit alcohol dehydrogenase family)
MDLHGPVNNAGIMAVKFETTVDGFESQFEVSCSQLLRGSCISPVISADCDPVNYLSHWLLTYLLLPPLQKAESLSGEGTVRVVNMTSIGHKMAPKRVGMDFDDIN